jgi:NAD(P)-dependent dehydrogenase (short-subunit alcohol dehydrogenase family)
MLALKGATVVLACRSREKGELALERIWREHSAAKVSLVDLDLADLDSVSVCARAFANAHERLDLLINNAGVMVPLFSRSRPGFELQFGTNHLGHFALACRLMHLLEKSTTSRVLVVSSAGANFGQIDFSDLNFEHRPYRKWIAYGQSKLANLMFALELARRLHANNSTVIAVAAHPGAAATDLQRNASFFRDIVNPLIAAGPGEGALPTLRAATDPNVQNGSYWGPSGLFEMRGSPGEAYIPKRAQDRSVAERLLDVSEHLTGLSFSLRPDERKALNG